MQVISQALQKRRITHPARNDPINQHVPGCNNCHEIVNHTNVCSQLFSHSIFFKQIPLLVCFSAMAAIPESLLRSTFAEFDKDGNGYLSAKELTPMFEMVAARHGLKCSKKEVKEICEVNSSVHVLESPSLCHMLEFLVES